MPPRLQFLSASLRGPVLRAPSNWSALRLYPRQFLCQTCQRKFSTSPFRRAIQKVAESKGKYKSRLLIYDAGDARTTWVSFWKAVALLQFGTTLVFFVPPLWKNENQPDPNVRKGQAILVGLLGTIPTLTLAYVTAPFVHQVFMQIPEHARRSRADLMRFVQTLNGQKAASANTKLEFVTLRIFPFRKNTAMFLHELRALPPRRLRIANIELPKSDAWAKRQREKGIFRRMLEVINEPRFKFYVKEGRMYTLKTSAPGVWEEVAKRIQEQTKEEADASATISGAKRPVLRPIAAPRPAPKPIAPGVKRQTARGPKI